MNRKSFILYHDSLEILDELNYEEAGELFRAIRAHVAGKKFEFSSFKMHIFFEKFKDQFDKNQKKYA